jgi:hypothetical protein
MIALRRRVTVVYGERADGTPWTVTRIRSTGEVRPYISLPSMPMIQSWSIYARTKRGRLYRTSCLRVGLVLHEFAHVLDALAGRRGHGSHFVATLDSLVAWWRDQQWRAQHPGLAAIAAGYQEAQS